MTSVGPVQFSEETINATKLESLAGLYAGIVAGVFSNMSPALQLAVAYGFAAYAFPTRSAETMGRALALADNQIAEILAMGWETAAGFLGYHVAVLTAMENASMRAPNPDLEEGGNRVSLLLPLDSPFGVLTQEDIDAHAAANFTINMVGGPQPIGGLTINSVPFDNPVTNVRQNSASFGPAAQNFADMANGGIFGGGKGGSSSAPDVDIGDDD